MISTFSALRPVHKDNEHSRFEVTVLFSPVPFLSLSGIDRYPVWCFHS